MVYAVVIKRKESRSLILGGDMPPVVDAAFDLREATPLSLIADAFAALWPWHRRVIRVKGQVAAAPDMVVETILDERPMQAAMYDYSGRILTLSIVISLITAVLVFLSLHGLLVRPMRRMTRSMIEFRNDPEDPARTIGASERGDEVGTAQRELADMQSQLRAALRQKNRLAALGTAVSKINHDLRNILATAQLVSDRLAGSADPDVKRVVPTLVRSLDRAAALCADVLRYGRAERRLRCACRSSCTRWSTTSPSRSDCRFPTGSGSRTRSTPTSSSMPTASRCFACSSISDAMPRRP